MREHVSAYVSGDRDNGTRTGKLLIEPARAYTSERGTYFMASGKSETVGLWVTEDDSRKLATSLAVRYGLVAPADLKIGDTVTLAPGAKNGDGAGVELHGATTARLVTIEPDSDGDIRVELIGGTEPGTGAYVLPTYIRAGNAVHPRPVAVEAPAAASVLAPGMAVRLVEAHREGFHTVPAGTSGLIRRRMVAAGMWEVHVVVRDTFIIAHVPAAKLAPIVPAETSAPFVLVDGATVAMDPDARAADGCRPFGSRRVTRVMVIDSTPDGDGDVRVRQPGRAGIEYVLPKYLSALPADDLASPALVVGKEMRLLSGARYSGGPVVFPSTVTRVKVVSATPDSDGDVRVAPLNGPDRWRGVDNHVFPRYLVALDDPTGWSAGDIAIVNEDYPESAHLYAGDRVKVKSLDALGRVYVDFLSGRGRAPFSRTGWYVMPAHLRRP